MYSKFITFIIFIGLADLMRNENSLLNEYKKAFEIAKPGPHVFLIVLSVATRFTKENIEVIDFIQNYFGIIFLFLNLKIQ